MRLTTSTCHYDHAHLQNLLRVGSALLDAANKRHWELIQQTEGGTAWLLQHYEAYASALAQNMRHTYLSPFTIVTPNIGEMALDCGGLCGESPTPIPKGHYDGERSACLTWCLICDHIPF